MKGMSTSKIKGTRKNIRFSVQDLVTKNTRVNVLPLPVQNVWPMLQFIHNWVKLQGQGR